MEYNYKLAEKSAWIRLDIFYRIHKKNSRLIEEKVLFVKIFLIKHFFL